MKIVDVSRTVFTDMTVWPGDEGVILKRTASISKGSNANVSRLHLGVHAGTHVDAPLHFIDGGKSIDKLDINLFNGAVQIVDMQGRKSIDKNRLSDIPLQRGGAIFFKTAASLRTLREPFDTEYTGLEPEAAEYLLEMGVRVVGTDALSVERYDSNEYKVHKLLLGNEVLIIEGLCFKDVFPGRYWYTCLPLFLKGSDGAPARVILFDENSRSRI